MVKKLIHIADIHIRTFQLHDLYKTQFEKFLEEIKKQVVGYNFDEVRVVIAGDVAHQKINISNEQMMLTSWFINELATNIGKVIIIPGNHDFLENNTQRLDSITPIVELLNNDDISYFKNSGVYKDDNINWVVYSLYQHNERPQFEKSIDGEINVGLFHGVIQGMSTDIGFQFEDGYDRLNFVDLDLLLCGDIHKRQQFKLPNGGKGVMVGSLIQQNFGETVKHHGYGIYDVENDEYTFHDLPNEQPFLHFSINDITDIENEKEELLNLG
jgi:DNA repair exonuclease SbcCD nuclease subunit